MNQIIFGNFNYYNLLTQVIGIIGIIFNFITFQQNTNKRIVAFQICASAAFVIHFFMLGAVTGAVLNIFGILRNIVLFNRNKDWAKGKYWLYIFCAVYIITGIVTFQNIFSILPTVGMLFGTVAVYIVSPKKTRIVSVGCSVSWLSYNAISFSIPGIITEVLNLISIGISMYKYDYKHLDQRS